MEPRTGKTQVAIDYACIMHEAGKVNRVLISCPVAVMGVWEQELEAVIPDRIKYTVTIWDKKGRRNQMLPKWGKDRLDFVIINHDGFAAPGRIMLNPDGTRKLDRHGNIRRSRTRGGRYEMKRAFLLWQPQLVCLDESHRYKTTSSAKFRTMYSILWDRTNKIYRVPYRIIMTGTPITKKKRVFDIYAQWRLLNNRRFRAMTIDDFKHHFGRFIDKGNYEMWVGNRPEEVEKLRAVIHRDSFAVTRDECYDIPRAVSSTVPLELEGDTAKAYDEMAEWMVAQLKSGEITEASIKLVQAMRLAQITTGVAKTLPSKEHPKGQLIRIGHEKLTVLESLLSDLFEADEKVVVAARFSHDISAIGAICDRLKVKHFTLQGRRKGAHQSRTERTRDILRFKTMEGPACYVVQPQSGSMGIDLSSAATLIWYSLTNSWVDYTQMNDRIALNPHGSIMHLLASPVDYLLFESLQEDGNVAKMITDSPERLLRNYKA